MRIKIRNEFVVINLCSLVLILIISIVDIQALRIVLGLPFLLFFPGYTLVATLFPKRSDLGTTERAALSVGLSVIITSGVGLILTHVWEIGLYPILVSLTIVIAALSATALYRRRKVAKEDRPALDISLPFNGSSDHNMLDRVVSVMLVLALVGAIGTLAYTVAKPNVGERFTELYMLDAESLPRELPAGEKGTIVLGVVNREHETMSYRVEVLVGGHPLPLLDPIELDHGEGWEGEIEFAAAEISARTKMTEEVIIPTGTPAAEVKSVKVESTSSLEPGDHVMIGQEAATVLEIAGQALILKEGLRRDHSRDTDVIELQKVEFRLYKSHQMSDRTETTLSLWIGKENLVASVVYRGGNETSYEVDVRIDGGQNGEPLVRSVRGPPDQDNGDVWTPEIDYPFSEMNEIQFSLYRDGALIYRRSESEPYPSVYLWIVVT